MTMRTTRINFFYLLNEVKTDLFMLLSHYVKRTKIVFLQKSTRHNASVIQLRTGLFLATFSFTTGRELKLDVTNAINWILTEGCSGVYRSVT